MKKRAAITQSNYIPWKGYFDLIASVDEFILFDDAQYTRRDWRNRNRIKTPKGVKWLTIPVYTKGRYYQKIKDTTICDTSWNTKHWKTIEQNYHRAPFFEHYRERFEDAYHHVNGTHLSQINYWLIQTICDLLGIGTRITWSMDHELVSDKNLRLIQLCNAVGASEYLTGPAAKSYLKPEMFEEAGIDIIYADYSGYPEYKQLHPPFDHHVSIVDLIFNAGPNAADNMKAVK